MNILKDRTFMFSIAIGLVFMFSFKILFDETVFLLILDTVGLCVSLILMIIHAINIDSKKLTENKNFFFYFLVHTFNLLLSIFVLFNYEAFVFGSICVLFNIAFMIVNLMKSDVFNASENDLLRGTTI